MGLFDVTWSLQVERILPPVLRERSFRVENDDFMTGEAENNYIEYILLSSPGHWKEYPLVGVGIWKYLNGTQSPQVLQRDIQEQLRADIFTKPYVDVRRWPTLIINKTTFELNGV